MCRGGEEAGGVETHIFRTLPFTSSPTLVLFIQLQVRLEYEKDQLHPPCFCSHPVIKNNTKKTPVVVFPRNHQA